MQNLRGALLLLLLLAFSSPLLAQEPEAIEGERARSESMTLSIALPKGWESFQGDPKVQGEVLFLQSPQNGPVDATIRLSAFPMPRNWDDLMRRETFQLVVEMDAPIQENTALTLRGAKGHKWVYMATSSSGQRQLNYRMYLALPATAGANRLLVMHGTAPEGQASEAVHVFNSLARSLAWGGDSAP